MAEDEIRSDGMLPDIQELLHFARAHGETSDTREWIDNLERMLMVAWDIMTEGQRRAFREHADVLAIAEAAGEMPRIR